MDYLIFAKWNTDWSGNENRAPGIVGIMINMFLKMGEVDTTTNDAIVKSPSDQQSISNVLLVVSILSVPTMLLVKPLYLYFSHKNNKALLQDKNDVIELEDKSSFQNIDNSKPKINEMLKTEIKEGVNLTLLLNQTDSKEDHNFGEIFIHQLIETIEFALGTVSNTASYLRLWALSLAHGQLADVFFSKLLGDFAFAGTGNAFLLSMLFPVFASFSIFVLMCMDSMECFLHTLRLHWVEFQNKFYKGNGYKFVPLSFNQLIYEEITYNMNQSIKVEEVYEEGHHLDMSGTELRLMTTPPSSRKHSDAVNKSDGKISDFSFPENEVKLEDLTKNLVATAAPMEEEKGEVLQEIEEEIVAIPLEDPVDNRKNKTVEKLIIQLKHINFQSLDDVKERLKNLFNSLKQHNGYLQSANIIESDPVDVYNSNVNFENSISQLEGINAEHAVNIFNIEKLLREVQNLISNQNQIESEDLEILELKLDNVTKINTSIISLAKDIDIMSIEQTATIEKLRKFLHETKPKQIERCDLSQNYMKLSSTKNRIEFCFQILESLTKRLEEESLHDNNEQKTQNIELLQSKMASWNERYEQIETKQNNYSDDLAHIKNMVDIQKDIHLNMYNIREILAMRDENYQQFEANHETVNILIDEIKVDEQQFAEFVDNQNLMKKLADETLQKINLMETLKVKFSDLYSKYDLDLANLLHTLSKTTDNADYNKDQDKFSSLFQIVNNEIAQIRNYNELVEAHIPQLKSLSQLSHKNIAETHSVAELEQI